VIIAVLVVIMAMAVPSDSATVREAEDTTRAKMEPLSPPCPPGVVCLAIPGFSTSTQFEDAKNNIISSALPELLQIALLKYPAIRPVSTGDLWRALRATYDSPEDWRPSNLSKTEVLRRAGANYVLRGRLYERQGTIQLVGGIISLIEDSRWSSQTLRSGQFPEHQLFEGISSFAAAIIDGLAEADRIDYQRRVFITAKFCDASELPTRRSRLYADDLPRAIAGSAMSIEAATVKFVELSSCITRENAESIAENFDADGVVRGAIELEEGKGELSLNAEVFLTELKIWRNMPIEHGADASYLELKYLLLDRFEQFLKLAMIDNGKWQVADLSLPHRLPDLLDRAGELIEQGKLDAANFLLAEALLIEPKSAAVRLRAAEVSYQQGSTDQAIEQAQEAIRHAPDFVEAYRLLGQVYLARKDYESAKSAYEEWALRDPDSSDAYLALGNVAMFQGDEPRAIELLQKALRLNPDNSEVRLRLVDIYSDRASKYERENQYVNAYENFNKAIELDPSPSADNYFLRAYTYARAVILEQLNSESGYQPAIDDYRKALDLFTSGQDPAFRRAPYAFLNIQELYILEGDYQKAALAAREFLEMESKTINRNTRSKVLAHFHVVVASILADKPYQRPMQELQDLLRNPDPPGRRLQISPGWSFQLLKEYLAARKPPVSAQQAAIIRDLISQMEAN
jgi:tetratricopeptide (TPR) repeat protein